MKGYIVFCGECYYARGGMNDFLGVEPTVEAAEALLVSARFTIPETEEYGDVWWQIVDAETLKVVKRSNAKPHGASTDETSKDIYFKAKDDD